MPLGKTGPGGETGDLFRKADDAYVEDQKMFDKVIKLREKLEMTKEANIEKILRDRDLHLTIKGEEVWHKYSDSQLAYDMGLGEGQKVAVKADKKKIFSYHCNNKYKEEKSEPKMILPSYMKPLNWRNKGMASEAERLQMAGQVLGLTKEEITAQKRELLYVLRKSGFGRKHRHNYKVLDLVQA